LVEQSVEEGIPFRAVVADSFYGEDEGFKQSLSELEVGYVMASKPSHAWWHKIGEIGSPWEAALAAGEGWGDERHPGDWVKVKRHFRDGHEQEWWALEVDMGPYRPQSARRSVVATTDPEGLPEKRRWYLSTNLTHPDSDLASESDLLLAPASVAEVVRLYGLRMWVEQSYKQVKHVLGWSDYQVRSYIAIRRHWQLVCLAFSFRWWAYGHLPTENKAETQKRRTILLPSTQRGGEKESSVVFLAAGFESSKGVAGALRHAEMEVERLLMRKIDSVRDKSSTNHPMWSSLSRQRFLS
jgi:hypothetical protein